MSFNPLKEGEVFKWKEEEKPNAEVRIIGYPEIQDKLTKPYAQVLLGLFANSEISQLAKENTSLALDTVNIRIENIPEVVEDEEIVTPAQNNFDDYFKVTELPEGLTLLEWLRKQVYTYIREKEVKQGWFDVTQYQDNI